MNEFVSGPKWHEAKWRLFDVRTRIFDLARHQMGKKSFGLLTPVCELKLKVFYKEPKPINENIGVLQETYYFWEKTWGLSFRSWRV